MKERRKNVGWRMESIFYLLLDFPLGYCCILEKEGKDVLKQCHMKVIIMLDTCESVVPTRSIKFMCLLLLVHLGWFTLCIIMIVLKIT